MLRVRILPGAPVFCTRGGEFADRGRAIKPQDDKFFMTEALKEARLASRENEVPVGCVIVHEGRIVGRAHNQRERLSDPTAHAEMIAITQASAALESWRLTGCTAYVTIEPCAMCAGALVLARVDRLVFGPRDEKAGACGTLYNIAADERLNHRIEVTEGVLADEAAALLKDFFRRRRIVNN